jgi:hypothetical protein
MDDANAETSRSVLANKYKSEMTFCIPGILIDVWNCWGMWGGGGMMRKRSHTWSKIINKLEAVAPSSVASHDGLD